MTDMDFFEKQAFERAMMINRPAERKVEAKAPEKIKMKSTSLPVEFSSNYSYPNFKTVFEEAKNVNENNNNNKDVVSSNKLNDVLKDPEAALLTGLIMLLKSEGADETLLAALGYILL